MLDVQDLKKIKRMLTPREVADLLGLLKIDCVIEAIAAGDLVASNVGMGKRRPTWRIRPADLEAFIERRRAVPAVAAPAPRQKYLPQISKTYFK